MLPNNTMKLNKIIPYQCLFGSIGDNEQSPMILPLTILRTCGE